MMYAKLACIRAARPDVLLLGADGPAHYGQLQA
jgi:hypothetical protein